MLWSDMDLAMDFFYLFDIDFSVTNKFWKMETTFIPYFIFLNISEYLSKNLVELPINKTFDLKFSCSTGDEWSLVYNKK